MKVGALIFTKFELLDLYGPLQMLGMMKDVFSIQLVAPSMEPIMSNGQVSSMPDCTFSDSANFDIILVPGGIGTREAINDTEIIDWIERKSKTAQYTLSICTGSGLLAKAGVLDYKKATSNKASFHWAKSQSDKVNWEYNARWTQDGSVFTSSGVSAGIDMTLGFIAHLHGRNNAEKIAQWAEYNWNDNPDKDDFADLYKNQK